MKPFSHLKSMKYWYLQYFQTVTRVPENHLGAEIRFWIHTASQTTLKNREQATENEDLIAIPYGNWICFIKILTVFYLGMNFQNYLDMNPH